MKKKVWSKGFLKFVAELGVRKNIFNGIGRNVVAKRKHVQCWVSSVVGQEL